MFVCFLDPGDTGKINVDSSIQLSAGRGCGDERKFGFKLKGYNRFPHDQVLCSE